MPTLQVVGQDYTCFNQTVNTNGSTITTGYPVKTFLVKAVGGEVLVKRNSTDGGTSVYLMEDRETIGFDLKMPWSSTTNTAPLGTFTAVEGSVVLYFMVGY